MRDNRCGNWGNGKEGWKMRVLFIAWQSQKSGSNHSVPATKYQTGSGFSQIYGNLEKNLRKEGNSLFSKS